MSDTDSSSENHSSSECSTDSSEDDRLETIFLCGTRLQIPQGLCEKREIFDEFFSPQTWNSLSDSSKHHLRQFLPTFPENDDQNKNVTLQRIFNGERFKFSSPLDNFYEHLKAGHYRPDIAKMRYLIRKAEREESMWRYKRYREQLESELIESRKRLMNEVKNLPPGMEPRLNKTPLVTNINPIIQRTKRRYFQCLSNVRSKVEESGFSSDDNFPEGAPASIPRKQKRHLNSLKNSHVLNGEKIVVSTMSTRQSGLDLEKSITSSHNPFSVNEQMYKQLLKEHKKRKMDNSDSEDLDTKGRTVEEIINRSKLNYNKKFNKPEIKVVKKKIKKEPVVELTPDIHYSSDSDSEPILEHVMPSKPKPAKKVIKNASPKSIIPPEMIKVEEKVEPVKTNYLNKITPATLSDLDGIDMMTIPIDLEDSNIDILDINSKAELMQDTHSNFLALIRDIICSTTEHRMGMDLLEERLKAWQENPITALNDWYCFADNWVSELQSAINFLSGNSPEQPEDFVPYIEYKPSLNAFQWIGAGRDSDNLLAPLFQYWLDHKNEMKPVISIKDRDDVDLDVLDRSLTPPLSRCPTTWTVRKADSEEIRNYRELERRRYDNPHKAFTYRCNGYESVVGPIKGVYNTPIGNTKARGHTMLSADRPNFVTILSLVRDAAARLPNGEGTRAEICELLKSSQYISSTAPDNVLQSVVSGALDRMHTQFDPCVKYDPKRKTWIYLHRNRTEEDFERIHQQYQGMSKNMKRPQKIKTPTKPKPKAEKTIKTNIKVNDSHEKPTKSTPVTQDNINKQTSLLISQNPIKQEITNHEEQKKIIKQTPKLVNRLSQEEKEINEALQSIVQQNNIIKSKTSKNVVKIISSNQDKPVVIPPNPSSAVKQETRVVTSKISQTPITTQQLIQTLAQQKQVNPQQLIRVEIPETSKETKKAGINIQQQILQGISQQQLQSLKNVTLLRNMRHSNPQSSSPQTIVLTDEGSQQSVMTISAENSDEVIKVQQPQFTLSQQQQIIQSIRQKGLSNLGSQQQVLIRHKAPLLQKNLHTVSGTSLLGQTRVVTDTVTSKPMMAGNQASLVAKVLTNAAGQVISVESLLAHQKQHGVLPQGTTLRVSGVKGGPNIIQLAAPSLKATSLGQVVGQNNYITLSSQPKLVLSSTPSSTNPITSVKTVSKPMMKSQTLSKFTPKVAQQIINAKFITQNVETQKLVQPKVILGQNQIKMSNKNVQSTKVSFSQANSIRMLNTANINLAHLRGNPVLLASKGSTLQNMQNVIIQTQANTVEGGGIVAINSTKNTISHTQNANMNVINQQGQVVLAPQIKMQPQMVLSSSIKSSGVIQGQATSSGQIIVGGHPVRLQSNNTNAQRVVLASQGQGGQFLAQQILLPAGFQGTAINIKSLQGVKVIPIAQTQQAKGVQGRQVFARVMNPSSIVRTTIVPSTEMTNTTPTTE